MDKFAREWFQMLKHVKLRVKPAPYPFRSYESFYKKIKSRYKFNAK